MQTAAFKIWSDLPSLSVSAPAGPAASYESYFWSFVTVLHTVFLSDSCSALLCSDMELFWCVCSFPIMPLTSEALHGEDLIVWFDVVQRAR